MALIQVYGGLSPAGRVVPTKPGNVHPTLGADDDLQYVVNRLRQAWPDVVIHVRGDAGFGIPRMYDLCEHLGLTYTFGLSTNAVLKRATETLLQRAIEQFEQTREPTRLFDQMLYRSGSWKNPRRVIAKAECNRVGTNLRFVVTNRPGRPSCPRPAMTITSNEARAKTVTKSSRMASRAIGSVVIASAPTTSASIFTVRR